MGNPGGCIHKRQNELAEKRKALHENESCLPQAGTVYSNNSTDNVPSNIQSSMLKQEK